MSVEIRFHEPVQVVYLVPEMGITRGIPTVNLDLKVVMLHSMAEAAELEQEMFSIEEQYRDVCPRLCGHGSLALQLVSHLYALTGHADRVLSGEDAVEEAKPEEPRCSIAVPPIITREWMLNMLGEQLGLPVGEVNSNDPAWFQAEMRWSSDAEKELVSFHGKDARADLLVVFIKMAREARSKFKTSPVAVGLTSETVAYGGEVFRLWFKLEAGDMVTADWLARYGTDH